jgi:predicted nucleotidyltransferase
MNSKRKSLDPMQKETVIQKIRSSLEKHDGKIVAVYIFGSFNTEARFSDIDLAVLFRHDLENPLGFEIDLETELEKEVRYPVDVRVLNGAPVSFCERVIRGGRVIVDREPNARADFQGKILKQYFDFSPFRRRYLSEVSHAPV